MSTISSVLRLMFAICLCTSIAINIFQDKFNHKHLVETAGKVKLEFNGHRNDSILQKDIKKTYT